MKAALLFTGSGPIVILTSHLSLTDAVQRQKLHAKGIDKFIAYELPRDLSETDDLRVLDFNGQRAFGLFHLAELGAPTLYESGQPDAAA